MRRPVTGLVAAAVPLLVLAVPATTLNDRVHVPSVEILPENVDARAAYEEAARAFGAGAINPIELAVRLRSSKAAAVAPGVPDSALPALVARLRRDERVRGATIAARSAGWARVSLVPRGDGYGDVSRSIVEDLRSGRLGDLPPGAVLVGGAAANSLDAEAALFSDLPRVLVVVLGLTLIALAVAFRSIVLPVKGVALVLLVLAATFGALVLLFAAGPDISPVVPIVLIAVAIALSTDYEILLIDRIREEQLRLGDNTASVAAGLSRTAGVITSAAAVMIVVFLSFGLVGVATVQQLSIGLAIAVALDATIVRLVLVPASMRLLGRWNWWLPSWPWVRRHARANRHYTP